MYQIQKSYIFLLWFHSERLMQKIYTILKCDASYIYFLENRHTLISVLYINPRFQKSYIWVLRYFSETWDLCIYKSFIYKIVYMFSASAFWNKVFSYIRFYKSVIRIHFFILKWLKVQKCIYTFSKISHLYIFLKNWCNLAPQFSLCISCHPPKCQNDTNILFQMLSTVRPIGLIEREMLVKVRKFKDFD